MASKDITYKNNTFNISYEILNPKEEDTILILHGWGSRKELMKQAFGNDLNEFKHVYLDLPGFGNSSNDIALDTYDYARIVNLFLENLNLKPMISMGHSFGGKVSALLGTPYLILLSSAGIVIDKPWTVKAKIATFKILKPLGAGKIKKLFASSDVADMSEAMYETFKRVVDEDFEGVFKASKSKALCFWGKEDSATPLSSGEKISSLIKDSEFYPLDGDHFFFLKHSDFISKTISEIISGHEAKLRTS